MGLDGGGGGGGGILGVTGSFTGPAQALELIGNHAYAFSGGVQDAGSGAANITCLDFKTGNFYFVGTVEWATNNTGNENLFVNITQNGVSVYDIEWDTSVNNINYDQPINMIIPPYTEFKLKWGIAAQTRNLFVVMTGRIYRTRD